jgi:hypothetical protein
MNLYFLDKLQKPLIIALQNDSYLKSISIFEIKL